MAEMGFTPELIASASVNPFRFIYLSGAFQGAQGGANAAAAGQTTILGVTDGSVYQFDKTEHAVANGPITLQPSNTVQVEAGASVTAGAFLMADASGKAIVLANLGASTLAVSTYIALEAASSGEIFRAFRFGTRYLTGS